MPADPSDEPDSQPGASDSPESTAEERIARAAQERANELDLSGLGLSDVPESICQLPWLQTLRLDDNQLFDLPESISRLTQLQRLSLNDNLLGDLPECVGLLTQLQTLSLNNNALSELPDSLGRLTHLQTLSLDNNALSEFPDCIGSLTALQTLSLDENSLSDLPDSLGRLTQLQTLNLNSNLLSDLPDCVGFLTQLQTLSLNSNMVGDLPEFVDGLTQLRTLELSHNQLASLPDLVGQLKQLQTLNLDANGLADLPDSIGDLRQLRTLELGDNKLGSLPESIGQLTQLQSLELQGNRLSSLPESLGQLVQLQHLNLAGNQLSRLPESIGRLKQLLLLDLDGNQLTKLPDGFGQLAGLQMLRLNGNKLGSLPTSIGQLRDLQTLRLVNNFLNSLPESIGHLAQLQLLDLEGNRLGELPESIGQLTRLETLDLRRNQLSRLPEAFGRLAEVANVHLQGNQLSSLPESIGQLANLRLLDLEGNLLNELPESVGRLTRLESIDLRRNQLRRLPDAFGLLAELSVVHLQSNQLSSLPESIGELANLQLLDLEANQLSELPKSFGRLKRLSQLNAGDNRLRTLPDSFGDLAQLSWVNLDGNELSSLPGSLRALTNLQMLCLRDNEPLQLLDEVLGPTWEAVYYGSDTPAMPSDVLTYYFRTRDAEAAPLHEVKLLILGRGGAGKTSLRAALFGRPFDPDRQETKGIEIEPGMLTVNTSDVMVHMWDFAGQEITHATHQFFLSERSLYLVVLDNRANTAARDAEYWLRVAASYGKQSPVIVALNKFASTPFELDEAELTRLYPQIQAFIRTDCTSGRGIAELERHLQAAVAGLKDVFKPFPGDWHAAKRRFAEMRKETDPYLSMARYDELCEEHGVPEPERMVLARILDRLGVILYYGDDPRLREDMVLSPHWLTNGVYRLLRLKDFPGSGAELTLPEALAEMPEVEERMVRFLISLMERYELCFLVPNELAESGSATDVQRWLIPNVLPEYARNLGPEWFGEDALRLRYQYTVAPEGLIPRFIVRTYPLSMGADQRWRNGVILSTDAGQARALVRIHKEKNYVEIVATGPDLEGRRWLAAVAQFHLNQISPDFGQAEPLVELEMANLPGKFLELNVLRQDERKRKPITAVPTAQGSVRVNPTEELNRVLPQEGRQPGARQPLRVFVSYSHQDKPLYDIFMQNLAAMVTFNQIQRWGDHEILPGAPWDDTIRERLGEADIVIFLVSTPFVNSHYIQQVELKQTLQREQKGEVCIVSVLLEDVPLPRDHELAKRQMIRPNGMSVREYAAKNPPDYRYNDGFIQVQWELARLVAQIQESGRRRPGDAGWR